MLREVEVVNGASREAFLLKLPEAGVFEAKAGSLKRRSLVRPPWPPSPVEEIGSLSVFSFRPL